MQVRGHSGEEVACRGIARKRAPGGMRRRTEAPECLKWLKVKRRLMRAHTTKLEFHRKSLALAAGI